MKLNNKGFAVSTFMYMLLILAMILILATLAILSSRKMILDKQKNIAMEKVLQEQNKICKAINGMKSLQIGTEYECQVNDTEKFNFYVLSVEGSKVNLIMNRNICGTEDENNGKLTEEGRTCLIAWNSTSNDNSNGPVTAMEGIYNATKNWTNVPDIDLRGPKSYSDEGHEEDNSYGYGKIETTATGIKITKKDVTTEVTRSGNLTPVIPYETNKPLKARLPKLEEVYNTETDDNHCHGDAGSCPEWLTNGLGRYNSYYLDNEHITNVSGYWVLSSESGSRDALAVYESGTKGNAIVNGKVYGLRPVITVPISFLSASDSN